MGLQNGISDFFYRLGSAFRTNGNEYYRTNKLDGFNFFLEGSPSWESPDDEKAFELFLTTPQLYSVISLRGSMLASGAWKHYRKNGDNVEQVEFKNSDALKVLENPNPLMNGNDYLKLINENWCIFGNNYEYLNRPFANSVPASLSILPPTQMSIETTGKVYKQTKIEDIIKEYKLEGGGSTEKFEPKDINHFKAVSSQNPIKGNSPMRPIIMPISNIRAAYQFRNILMTQKGAIGILSNKSSGDGVGAVPLKADERDKIQKAYLDQYGIGDKEGKVIISGASLEWQSMSYPTKDLLLFEEIDANTRAIIDNYGLNDNLFSREKASTFSNLENGFKQAYQATIIPFAEELAMRYTKIFMLPDNEWLELDYSHLPALQKNEKERAEVLEKKANALRTLRELGVYNDDELKDIIDLD